MPEWRRETCDEGALRRAVKSPSLPVPPISAGSRRVPASLTIFHFHAQRQLAIRLWLPLRCSWLACFLPGTIVGDQAQRLVEDIRRNHLAAHSRIDALGKTAPFFFELWRNRKHL